MVTKFLREKERMIFKKQNMLHDDRRNIPAHKQGIIAEIEVMPHDYHYMSLGVFNTKQPKGFSIKLHPQNEYTKRVDTQVSSKVTRSGVEYFLKITNNTDAVFSAEVIQL